MVSGYKKDIFDIKKDSMRTFLLSTLSFLFCKTHYALLFKHRPRKLQLLPAAVIDIRLIP